MTTIDTTSARGELAKRPDTALDQAKRDIANMRAQFAMVLPATYPAERLVRVLQTVVGINPGLAAPTKRQALLGAAMTCAQLGLDPTPAIGHAYIIEYGGKPTFVLGYKGAVFLGADNGVHFKSWTIHENDPYEVVLGTEQVIRHTLPPFGVDRGKVVAVYCVATFADNAPPMFDVMSVDEIEAIRRAASSGNSPAWKNHWSEQAKKTVLKRLAKSVPIGTKLAQASAHDGVTRLDVTQAALDAAPQPADDNDVTDAEIVGGGAESAQGPAVEDPPADYDPDTGEVIPAGVGA